MDFRRTAFSESTSAVITQGQGSHMDSAATKADVPAPEERAAPDSSRREFLRAAATSIVAAGAAGSLSSASAAPAMSTFMARMNSPPSFYKQRASQDYRESMRPFGGQLA